MPHPDPDANPKPERPGGDASCPAEAAQRRASATHAEPDTDPAAATRADDPSGALPDLLEATLVDHAALNGPGLSSTVANEVTIGAVKASDPTLGGDDDPATYERVARAVPGYEVLSVLGRGGMGVVYLARQVRLNRPCALKMILAGDHASSEANLRFLAEAETVARLRHPNIVQIYHIGEHGGRIYLELEHVEGGSLAQKLEGTPWPPNRAARLVETLARAIAEAHRLGVVHRDLKPANILLATDGTPKITDFGLAKSLGVDTSLTQSGVILGSPNYMAPEQAEGKASEVGPAADLYALGAVLYELLTGRPPFKATTVLQTLEQVKADEPVSPGRLVPGTPRDIETIALKCLRKEPSSRYASAADLAQDLARFLAHEPIQARRSGPVERARHWCRRNPREAGFALAAAALLVSVAVVATIGYLQTSAGWTREAAQRQAANRQREEAVHQRDNANRYLYHSLLGQARALRLARLDGYRTRVWPLLEQALHLDTPVKDVHELRREAVACMGDFLGLEPILLANPEAEVRSLTVDSRAGRFAIGMSDGTISIRAAATGAEAARLRGHRAPVSAVMFGPDGRMVVSGDLEGTIKVWKLGLSDRWACTRTFTTDKLVTSLALTAGGKRLIACSRQASALRIWDLEAEAPAATFRGRGAERFNRIAVSPDAKTLAAATDGEGWSGVVLWDIATREVNATVPSAVGTVNGLNFSPDGQLLACACGGGVAILEAPDFRRRMFVRGDFATSVDFSPDNRLLAFTSVQLGVVRLWSIFTNREVAVLRHPGEPLMVAWSHDGLALVAASERNVRIWNLSGPGERLVLSGHNGGISGVAFRPDGMLLASAAEDNSVKIWDASTGTLVRSLAGFRAPVQVVAFSPDGRLLATGDLAGSVQIWDVPSWQPLASLDKGIAIPGRASVEIWSIVFFPDGKTLAIGGDGCGLTTWHVEASSDGESARPRLSLRRTGRVTDRRVWSVCISPDGKLLAWVEPNRTLHLWDLAAAREVPPPPARPFRPVLAIAFLPDGRHLMFVNGESHDLEGWDVTTGRKAFSFPNSRLEEESGTTSNAILALSPDGAWLALSGKSVAVWDTETRDLRFALAGELSTVWALAWSPDRKLLAIGSSDGGLVVWNLPRIRSQLAAMGLDW